jgi:TP901 family phage tail tape measure protein
MANKTSRLIVSLVDGVSAPARKAARGMLGIPAAVRQANGQMTSFSDRITGAIDRNNMAIDRARGRMFDAVAGFYAVSAAIGAPVRAAMQYETALSGIGSKAGLTAAQLAAIGAEARKIGASVNQGAPEILRAVDYLVGMGLSADDAMASVKAIGVAATATGADISDLSQAGFAAMSNLKVEATDVGLALDFMAKAGKAGGFELKDMAQYMPGLGASYAALGQEGVTAVADLSAALQIVRKDTGDASTAATNLQNVLQKMVSPGTEKKFKDMGVDLRKELALAAEQGLNPLEAIAAITHKTLKGDLSKIGYLFEDAQAQAGVRSLIQHMEDFQKIKEEAMGGAGENQKDFLRAMQTSEQRMKKFRIAMQHLGIVVGNTLVPILTALIDKVVPIVERFATWAAENPRLVGTIAAVTAGIIGLRIAMSALSYVALMGKGGILGAIASGATVLGGTAGHLWGAARASIALQTALGAMSGQSLGTFGKLAAGARGMLFAVPGVSMIASGISAIGAAIATISAPIWGAFALAAAAVAAVGVTIWKYWDRITSVFSGVGKALGEILAPALEAIRPVLDWFAPLGDLIASGWTKAGDAISAVAEWMGSFFQQETLSAEDKAAYEQAGYDAIMSLWNGMKKVATDMMNWVKELPGRILAALGTIDLSSVFSFTAAGSGMNDPGAGYTGMSGAMGDYNPYGERAGGGPMTAGRTYLVGEEGPELVTPSKGGYVHPNGTGPAASGGGSGITVAPVFNFTGVTASDAEAIKQKVMTALDQQVRSLFSGVYADAGMRTTG